MERKISITWSTEDVKQQLIEMQEKGHYTGKTLSDDEAWKILKEVKESHDCNYGITWETIESSIDNFFERKGGK